MQEYFCSQLISTQSNDAKKNIYEKVLPNYALNSNDSLKNIFLLLDELDSYDFKVKFIVPQIEKFIKLIEGNETNQLTQFYSCFNVKEDFIDSVEFSKLVHFKNFTYDDNIIFRLFEYLKIEIDWNFSISNDSGKNAHKLEKMLVNYISASRYQNEHFNNFKYIDLGYLDFALVFLLDFANVSAMSFLDLTIDKNTMNTLE